MTTADEPLAHALWEWIEDRFQWSEVRAEAVAARLGLVAGYRPTLEAAGARVGLTRERVRQLQKQVLTILRDELPAMPQLDDIEVRLEAAHRAGEAIEQVLDDHGFSEIGTGESGLRLVAGVYGREKLLELLDLLEPSELDPNFVRDARGAVRRLGVVALQQLHAAVTEKWDVSIDEVRTAIIGEPSIRIVDGVVVGRGDSVLSTAIRKALTVTTPIALPSLYGAVRRMFSARKIDPCPTYHDLNAFVSHSGDYLVREGEVTWASPSPYPLEGIELACVDIFEAAQGGLLPRDEFVDRLSVRGFSHHSATLYGTYSPVLELACAGVFRLRGRDFPLELAETLRATAGRRRGRWGVWGWTDKEHLWIEGVAGPEGLKLRPPADVLALLLGRRFSLLASDRRPLGSLEFDRDGRSSAQELQERYRLEEDHPVLVDIAVGQRPTAVLIMGGQVSGVAYPGDIDGCVLGDGGWGAVLHVDHDLLAGAPCLLPAPVTAKLSMEVGDAQEIGSTLGYAVRVGRKPHGSLVEGIANVSLALEAEAGDWLRVAIGQGEAAVTRIDRPAPGTFEELLAQVGVSEKLSGDAAFRRIGAALGLGAGSDRAAVVNAFERRGRNDLAELTRSIRNPKAAERHVDGLSVTSLLLDRRRLARSTQNGLLYAIPTEVATGAWGLDWSPDPGPEPSDEWALLALRFFAVWAASTATPIHIRRVAEGWAAGGVQYIDLLQAIVGNAPAEPPGFSPPAFSGAYLPLNELGIRRLCRRAATAGLTELRITPDGWQALWWEGVMTPPANPQQSLTPPV